MKEISTIHSFINSFSKYYHATLKEHGEDTECGLPCGDQFCRRDIHDTLYLK